MSKRNAKKITSKSSSKQSARTVWVRAYRRKNGTVVAGHYRSAPVR